MGRGVTIEVFSDLLETICLVEAGEHHGLDAELLDCVGLCFAAHEGVDVKLLGPLVLVFEDGG